MKIHTQTIERFDGVTLTAKEAQLFYMFLVGTNSQKRIEIFKNIRDKDNVSLLNDRYVSDIFAIGAQLHDVVHKV